MKTILTLLRKVGEFIECRVNEKKKTEVVVGDIGELNMAVDDAETNRRGREFHISSIVMALS